MYSYIFFSFIILGLYTLAKINGEVINNYTNKCNDIYSYLESQGKIKNFNDCKTNDKGEVTDLRLYPYCIENEQLENVLSYNTIETLEFLKVPILMDDFSIYDYDILSSFGCTSLPTNYKKISTLTELKYLDLSGVKNLDINVITNIPKSVEILKIGSDNLPYYFTLTQDVIDVLSKLTNLKSLIFVRTLFSNELDFKNFVNLKSLTSLEISYNYYRGYGTSFPDSHIPGNIFKYCNSLEKLVIITGQMDEDSLDSISNLPRLKELEFEESIFIDNANFSSLKKLKNLTSLSLGCYNFINTPKSSVSSDFLYLTNLKKFSITSCQVTISSNNTLNWTNLKNLEYLEISGLNMDGLFDFKYLSDLINLKELYIMGAGYFLIPESFENLKNLEVLEIIMISIDSLPKTIGNLEKLKILNLSYNNLLSLPDEIGNLKNLEKLNIQYNALNSLPESLAHLTNLKILEGRDNNIAYLPINIGNMTNLEKMDFSYNQIVELPKSIGDLKIDNLILNNNRIERIPDEIGNMKNLKNIDISKNNITNIPYSIGNLENLNILQLNDNIIDEIPESIGNLKNLEHINLSSNSIYSLPESIGDLENLKYLYLSDNKVTSFPISIGNLENLESLDLSFNKITRIPDEIGNLKNLDRLILHYNEITNLPESLGNLAQLTILDLENNLINDYLPESLNNLPLLSKIYLGYNINIKGKTLTNVDVCGYFPPLNGYTYSLCESANAKCKSDFLSFKNNNFISFQPCEEEEEEEEETSFWDNI